MIKLDPDIEKKLEYLELSENSHIEIAQLVINADGGNMYTFDLFVHAIFKRSLSIIFGFTSLIRDQNFIAAAPLIRLHIDTLLRLTASGYVDDPHDYAMKVLDGIEVRKMRDRTGAFMTDRRLVNIISKESPWIDRVYSHTNGYIHMSNKHMFNTMRPTGDDRKFKFVIGKSDSETPKELLLEAIDAMTKVTELLLNGLYNWYQTKDNPEESLKHREEWLNEKGLNKKKSPRSLRGFHFQFNTST